MPAVKGVGEPCAGEPHARFEVAAGGDRCQSATAARRVAPPADPTETSALAYVQGDRLGQPVGGLVFRRCRRSYEEQEGPR